MSTSADRRRIRATAPRPPTPRPITANDARSTVGVGGVEGGGQNVYVAQTARELARSGFAVDVFVLAESGGGFAHTDVRELADASTRLIESPDEARRVGRAAQAYARERFGIERFVADWNRVLAQVA